jgi:hypothetical protein
MINTTGETIGARTAYPTGAHEFFGFCGIRVSQSLVLMIDCWCFTPLSAIFQLYHGDQF